MNRRSFIGAIAVVMGASGCLGGNDMTESQKHDAYRSVELVSSDEVSDRLNTTLEARLVRSAITPDQTALLEIELTNAGDTERRYGTGTRPVFSGYESDSAPPGLALFAEDRGLDRAPGECWSLHSGEMPPQKALSAGVRLMPGESTSSRFEVWNHPKNTECLPPGTYRFGASYSIGELYSDDKPRFSWGFELRVNAAGDV